MSQTKRKAVVVFSGGQDSTTCLLYAVQQYDEVHAITFDYGQRHALEIEVAKQFAGRTLATTITNDTVITGQGFLTHVI